MRRIRFEDFRLTGNDRLLFVVLAGELLLCLRWRCGRIEFRAKEHSQPLVLVRLQAHDEFVLSEVKEFRKLLESELLRIEFPESGQVGLQGQLPQLWRIEVRVLLFHPAVQIIGSGTFLQLQPVNLENVAKRRDGFFGFRR